MTTGLFLLRALQAGLSIGDLDLLTIGNVYDIIIEQGNDDFDWPVLATQEDIARL